MCALVRACVYPRSYERACTLSRFNYAYKSVLRNTSLRTHTHTHIHTHTHTRIHTHTHTLHPHTRTRTRTRVRTRWHITHTSTDLRADRCVRTRGECDATYALGVVDGQVLRHCCERVQAPTQRARVSVPEFADGMADGRMPRRKLRTLHIGTRSLRACVSP